MIMVVEAILDEIKLFLVAGMKFGFCSVVVAQFNDDGC